MLYLKICFDKPNMTERRNAERAEHRAYLKPFTLEGAKVRIIQAGPMCVSDDDDTNLGSFMIVEAASRGEVVAFHAEDPLTKAGIYDGVRIVRWDRHI